MLTDSYWLENDQDSLIKDSHPSRLRDVRIFGNIRSSQVIRTSKTKVK